MTTATEQIGKVEVPAHRRGHQRIGLSSHKYKRNYLSKNNHYRLLVRTDKLFNRRILRFGMILPMSLEFRLVERKESTTKRNCSKFYFEIIESIEELDLYENEFHTQIEEYHIPLAERSVDFEIRLTGELRTLLKKEWPRLFEDTLGYNRMFNNKLFIE